MFVVYVNNKMNVVICLFGVLVYNLAVVSLNLLEQNYINFLVFYVIFGKRKCWEHIRCI